MTGNFGTTSVTWFLILCDRELSIFVKHNKMVWIMKDQAIWRRKPVVVIASSLPFPTPTRELMPQDNRTFDVCLFWNLSLDSQLIHTFGIDWNNVQSYCLHFELSKTSCLQSGFTSKTEIRVQLSLSSSDGYLPVTEWSIFVHLRITYITSLPVRVVRGRANRNHSERMGPQAGESALRAGVFAPASFVSFTVFLHCH